MALHLVTILADSLEQVAGLRGRGLDLHERAARRAENGVYEIPAALTDDEIARLLAQGYPVIVLRDAEDVAAQRAVEVAPEVNRLAAEPAAPASARRDADRDRAARGVLDRLTDLSDVGPDESVAPDEPDEPDGPGGPYEQHGPDEPGGPDEQEGPSDDAPGGTPALAEERSVLGGYLTPEEVETALTVLASAYPAVASVAELPEPSWEGRISHVLHLRAGAGQPRPGVLVTGGVHAREWGGSDICVAFAANLLRAFDTGSDLRYGGLTFPADDVRAVLETLDLFVVPDVNPDGKAYSQAADQRRPQNLWWRKNRRVQGMPPGVVGVDVNRNFDFLWSSGIGTEPDPTRATFKGSAPFSEPESRNVRALLDSHPTIAYHVDVHSYGELILFAWGDDDDQVDTPEQNFLNPAFDGLRGIVGDIRYREFIPAEDRAAVEELATAMDEALRQVRGRRYTVQQAVGLYPTSATSDDYAFSRHLADPSRTKTYGFTIEFGREFVPPYAEMRRIMADVAAALTEFCRRAARAGVRRARTADPSTTRSPR